MPDPRTRPAKTQAAAVLLAAVVVVASVGATASLAVAQSITELDADTPLTGSAAKKSFVDDGHVSVDIDAPELSITVSKAAEPAGLKAYKHSDVLHDYVCVDYKEDIGRTIRFYVPAKPYFDAFNKQNMASIDETHTATFSRVRDGRYTSVTIDFSGQGRACFKISETQSNVWGVAGEKEDQFRNQTGVGVPEKTQWSYISASEWKNSSSFTLDGVNSTENLIVEYDADPRENRQTWVVANDDRGDGDRLSWFEKTTTDGDRKVVIVSRADEPPTIRYKVAENSRDLFGPVKRDLENVGRGLGDVLDSIGSFLSGGSGGSTDDGGST